MDSVVSNFGQLSVTNVTSNSAVITFLTDGAAVASVKYATTAQELADQTGTTITESGSARQVHSIAFNGLTADRDYYFSIHAGGLSDSNDGDYHTFHTMKSGSGIPYSLYGQVLQTTGSVPATGTVVSVKVTDNSGSQSYPLSTVVESGGYWFLDLGNLKRQVTYEVFSWGVNNQIEVEVEAGSDGIGSKTVDLAGSSPQNAGTIVLSTEISLDVSLVVGLNLITLPLQPTVTPTSATLLGDIFSIKEVFTWQANNQSWGPSALKIGDLIVASGESDFDISLSSGYIVNLALGATWQPTGHIIQQPIPISLISGLNLIGVPHPAGVSAKLALGNITDGQLITRWRADLQVWQSVFKTDSGSVLGDDFVFDRLQGYFIQVGSASSWTPTLILTAPEAVEPELPPLALTSVSRIHHLTIGNLSSASATLAFRSNGVGRATIEYGTDPNLTEPEVLIVETPSSAHCIQLKGLNSQSQYYARAKVLGLKSTAVTSPVTTFRTTPTSIGQPTVIYGQILDIDGSAKNGELVQLTVSEPETISSSQPLLAISDLNGYWHLDLGNLKNREGKSWHSQPEQLVQVSILGRKQPALTGLLSEATTQNLGMIRFQQDIAGDITTDLMPVRSGLGQNYPNPFNPETWIPYQIRWASQVKVSIYNQGGDLVRRLDLGLKPAGYYTRRDQALYWDGRNDRGEAVSSGVYFYHLVAGQQSEIKKMIVIR